MIAPMQYNLTLDALDDSAATFRLYRPSTPTLSNPDPELPTLDLGRSAWEDLGRPTTLLVTLEERKAVIL